MVANAGGGRCGLCAVDGQREGRSEWGDGGNVVGRWLLGAKG